MSHLAAVKTLRTCPSMLALDVATCLRPRLQYLIDDAGLRPGDVAPMIHLDLESEIKPRLHFLVAECSLGAAAAADVICRNPRIICEDIEETLRPALRCLAREMELSAADIAHVLTKFPNVLFQTPEYLRSQTASFARMLGAATATKVFLKYPAVLMLSVEKHVEPKFNFLAYELGFGRESTRAILTKAPQLLGLDEDNIRPKVNFLVNDLGISREAAIAMVIRFPPLLTLDLENNLTPTAQFLRDAYIDMKTPQRRRDGEMGIVIATQPRGVDDDIGLETILTRHPSLLAMSVERKLRPTLSFLRRHYPKCPAPTAMKLCTFSLAGNIMPRVRLLEEHADGCNLRERWSVATVMGLSVDDFCLKAGVSRERYAAEVAACEADFHEELAALDTAASQLSGGGRAPRAAIRSAIQARGSAAAGTAADERRMARRKKREDEMAARNAAKAGVDEQESSS